MRQKVIENKIKNTLDEYFGLTPRDDWDNRVRDDATRAIIEIFRLHTDEVIGVDEDTRVPDWGFPVTRNGLRAEQRKRAGLCCKECEEAFT